MPLIRRIFIASAIAGVRIRTAYTLFSAFLLLINVQPGNNYNYRNNGYDNNIFHTACSLHFNIINNSYAFFAFFFALMLKATIIATNTATAISPPTKPAPKAPVVISVPSW